MQRALASLGKAELRSIMETEGKLEVRPSALPAGWKASLPAIVMTTMHHEPFLGWPCTGHHVSKSDTYSGSASCPLSDWELLVARLPSSVKCKTALPCKYNAIVPVPCVWL